ncbi:type II toxin-antitoxin system VapC family toxin [Indioceanicola profundi]|uniref:type II toxin-antitoxin system VapC family toxin n=1 Tax=Indioceanicola profundi TaxID=2220096 RepID=UPI000E6AB6E1|nr:PIN domain nuclease [Indioceanicola profundi]
MIVVDTSVWIDFFAQRDTEQTRHLRLTADPGDIIVGDIVLAEVLMGARGDRHASTLESALRQFEVMPMAGDALAVEAAANFRRLRAVGVTIRRTTDLFIGTFCIANGHTLLHRDRDFVGMEKHLGLKVL